jgi:hypothetical protein
VSNLTTETIEQAPEDKSTESRRRHGGSIENANDIRRDDIRFLEMKPDKRKIGEACRDERAPPSTVACSYSSFESDKGSNLIGLSPEWFSVRVRRGFFGNADCFAANPIPTADEGQRV